MSDVLRILLLCGRLLQKAIYVITPFVVRSSKGSVVGVERSEG